MNPHLSKTEFGLSTSGSRAHVSNFFLILNTLLGSVIFLNAGFH